MFQFLLKVKVSFALYRPYKKIPPFSGFRNILSVIGPRTIPSSIGKSYVTVHSNTGHMSLEHNSCADHLCLAQHCEITLSVETLGDLLVFRHVADA